jgi:isocitrate/isopropylmalate dehydrogenase
MNDKVANEYRGESEMKIGGEIRKLRFGLNAFANIQKATGMPLKIALESLQNIDVVVIRAIIWAGIGDDELSPEDIGEMIDRDIRNNEYTFIELIEMVSQAVANAFPDAQSKKSLKIGRKKMMTE